MFQDRAQMCSYGTAAVPKKCRISKSQVLDNIGVHSQEQSGTAVGIFHPYTHTIQQWQEGRLARTEKVTP